MEYGGREMEGERYRERQREREIICVTHTTLEHIVDIMMRSFFRKGAALPLLNVMVMYH